MRVYLMLPLFLLGLAAIPGSGASAIQETSIQQFPEVAALLRLASFSGYTSYCSSVILNNRSVVTSARCVVIDVANTLRIRAGSSLWNSGGTLYVGSDIITNNYDQWSMMNDIAIVRSATAIAFGTSVQPGRFAGTQYALADNQPVSTAGWGYNLFPVWQFGSFSTLHQIQTTVINVDLCRQFYGASGFFIQNTMICSGFTNTASTAMDKCFGEPGSPLYHQGVVVGIRSFTVQCSNVQTPSVNTRISSFINWLSANA